MAEETIPLIRGADALRGVGAVGVLRTALRVSDADCEAERTRCTDEPVARAKRPRRPVDCSGEVAERSRLTSLNPPAWSMVDGAGAVTSAVWV